MAIELWTDDQAFMRGISFIAGVHPIGVYYDNEKNRFRACMSYMGKQFKLGNFTTAEAAFARYKECKEKLIKDIAGKHKDKIPYKVYEAMMNWEISITD